MPTVDILVLIHWDRKWLDGLLQSLSRSTYPAKYLRLVVVDNASPDDSVAHLRSLARSVPFPVEVVETGKNEGFTGGYQIAMKHAVADYWFVLNPDTKVAPDTIERLVTVMESDPTIGVAEARQAPREHPKYYDPFTKETSWCSGACMMVRPAAVADIGGGFDKRFFMYAEDVDLSWRMWLHGWRCVYVPEAVVEHYTEDLNPDKPRFRQHYYSMRNGAWMRFLYGSFLDTVLYYLMMLRVILFSRNPLWHRCGTAAALASSLWGLWAMIGKRREIRHISGRHRHRWIVFNGWEYGRHLRDVSLVPPSFSNLSGSRLRRVLLLPMSEFRRAAVTQAESEDLCSIDLARGVAMVNGTRDAILTYGECELEVRVELPDRALLCGYVALAPNARKVMGEFVVKAQGVALFRRLLQGTECGQWHYFEVVLQVSGGSRQCGLGLEFRSLGGTTYGYWADLNVYALAQSPPEHGHFPAISVIVPTHNRADSVRNVVTRLLAQDAYGGAYEVIVVDSCSSDGTFLALGGLAKHPCVRVFRCEKPGAASARNIGLANARGELLVLLDDDILVGRDFLSSIWEAHRASPDSVLLARIVAPWAGLVDPFLRYLDQTQEVNIYNFPDPNDVPPNYFYTGCVAIPRSCLRGTRFDEGFVRYGVEDIDFGFRLLRNGTRMVYLPHITVWHDYYPSFEEFRRKKVHAGYSLGYMVSKRPWLADNFRFPRLVQKHHKWLKRLLALSNALRRLAELAERILCRTGPVNRFLALWYKVALRCAMYEGFLEFQRDLSKKRAGKARRSHNTNSLDHDECVSAARLCRS